MKNHKKLLLIPIILLLAAVLLCIKFKGTKESVPETCTETETAAAADNAHARDGLSSDEFRSETETSVIETATETESGIYGGHIVCIDAGHQASGDSGTEPNGPGSSAMKARVAGGTRGVSTGIPEYELTLAVAKLLQSDLEANGIQVVMVRDTNDVNISNAERAQFANSSGADVYIRIHADGSESASAAGAHSSCMTSSNPWNAYLYNDSYRLSSDVINSYCAATGFSNLGVRVRDDLTGTNWSKIPVTLIELGFMSNPNEDQAMNDASMQQTMAQSICDGILAYYAGN